MIVFAARIRARAGGKLGAQSSTRRRKRIVADSELRRMGQGDGPGGQPARGSTRAHDEPLAARAPRTEPAGR